MKELGVKWLTELYDHFRGQPEILVNYQSFTKAIVKKKDIDPFSDCA